jgi:hypothetical protein
MSVVVVRGNNTYTEEGNTSTLRNGWRMTLTKSVLEVVSPIVKTTPSLPTNSSTSRGKPRFPPEPPSFLLGKVKVKKEGFEGNLGFPKIDLTD